MAREGTRSATGNSKPRVFPVIDTEPAVKRTTKPKVVKKVAEPKPTSRAAAKPVGVTKKKAAPKKEAGVVKKVKAAVKETKKKVEKKADKAEKEAKPKATKKKETPAPAV